MDSMDLESYTYMDSEIDHPNSFGVICLSMFECDSCPGKESCEDSKLRQASQSLPVAESLEFVVSELLPMSLLHEDWVNFGCGEVLRS